MREHIKKLREEKGLSQQDVANKLNITQQYYSCIENGERQQKMSIDTARKLANVFGVSIDVIIESEC